MSTDFEIFKGKDLSNLFKDIYDNQQSRKKNISSLIQEIRNTMRNVGDWAVMGPVIKDLIDTSVKNDDSLIKLATIVQRIISASTNDQGEVGILTDREKAQLLKEVEDAANNIIDGNDTKIDDLTFEVEGLKNKIKNDEPKNTSITPDK